MYSADYARELERENRALRRMLNQYQRTRYRFSHRAGDRYYWEGPRVDSRSEQISCRCDWFWGANA